MGKATGMVNERTLIEQRDEARRVYKEAARNFRRFIDRDGEFLDRRKKGLKGEFLKAFDESIREFVFTVDSFDDIDVQIILFSNAFPLITVAIIAGSRAAKNHMIKVINEFNTENSEAARNAARSGKIKEMKEIKEFVFETAKKYLSENPKFAGTRNALMVQIEPDITKMSLKLGRRRTPSKSTITNYLNKCNLP